jgi:hypothetical protein
MVFEDRWIALGCELLMNRYIQWRREEVKAGGGYFENGRKCKIFRKSETILDEFSPEIGESYFQKAEGGYPPSLPPARAVAALLY